MKIENKVSKKGRIKSDFTGLRHKELDTDNGIQWKWKDIGRKRFQREKKNKDFNLVHFILEFLGRHSNEDELVVGKMGVEHRDKVRIKDMRTTR